MLAPCDIDLPFNHYSSCNIHQLNSEAEHRQMHSENVHVVNERIRVNNDDIIIRRAAQIQLTDFRIFERLIEIHHAKTVENFDCEFIDTVDQ
jgi:hypothetical protein